MDRFEKHIKENREVFDEFKADKAKLWVNIELALDTPNPKPKVIKLWKSPIFKIAASIVIAFGIFISINKLSINTNSQISSANQELSDINMHYQELVAYQVNLVNKSTKLSSKEKKEFLSFLDDLDKEYELLKVELNKNIDSELILEAIVTNYKKRIELIENLLKQINSSEKVDESNEYIL